MSIRLKALVIDDSGVMRKMVMRSLTESKLTEFEFTEAVDGKDALDKVTSDTDIAFVDWNMPNMTGIEFVKEIRSREKNNGTDAIPLVMVTSEKTMGKLQEALDEAGADSFISKPFTVEELQVKLRKVIEKAQILQSRRLRRKKEREQPQPVAGGGFFSKLFD